MQVILRVKGPELYSVTVPSRCSLQEVKDRIHQQTGLLPSVLIHKGIAYAGRILTEKETTFRNQDGVCMACAPLEKKERGGTMLPMPEVKVLARGERQEGIRVQVKPFRLDVSFEEKKGRPTLWVEEAEVDAEAAANKEMPRREARQQPPAGPPARAVPSPAPNPMSQSDSEQFVKDQMGRFGLSTDPSTMNAAMELLKMPGSQGLVASLLSNPDAAKDLMATGLGPQLLSQFLSGQGAAKAGMPAGMPAGLDKHAPAAARTGSHMGEEQSAAAVRSLQGMQAELRAMGFTDGAANAKALQESEGDLEGALNILLQQSRN